MHSLTHRWIFIKSHTITAYRLFQPLMIFVQGIEIICISFNFLQQLPGLYPFGKIMSNSISENYSVSHSREHYHLGKGTAHKYVLLVEHTIVTRKSPIALQKFELFFPFSQDRNNPWAIHSFSFPGRLNSSLSMARTRLSALTWRASIGLFPLYVRFLFSPEPT